MLRRVAMAEKIGEMGSSVVVVMVVEHVLFLPVKGYPMYEF